MDYLENLCHRTLCVIGTRIFVRKLIWRLSVSLYVYSAWVVQHFLLNTLITHYTIIYFINPQTNVWDSIDQYLGLTAGTVLDQIIMTSGKAILNACVDALL